VNAPSAVPAPPPDHRYETEIEAERAGWHEFVGLVRTLTPEECLVPGYSEDPPWTVRDVVAHVGAWLAEAEVQFERMAGGTYEGHDLDVAALEAEFLAAMDGQPWVVVWVQANAGRVLMLQDWYRLEDRSEEAAWWFRTSGCDHYTEHIRRLREWTAELTSRRATT
jgi:hypothetical protein